MKESVREISLKAFAYTFAQARNCNRRFCFILGSGASREAGILTGVEMAKIWAGELEKKYEEKELDRLKKQLNIDSVEPNSKNYFGIYDLRFYPDYQEGYAYLERELEKGNPSLGHHVLAKILAGEMHNLAITTNFDSLIEDALFIYTNKHPLVVGHESLTEFINLNIRRPIVAKIHRSLYFHPFNRQQETDGLAEGWQETLKNAFMVYTPVVVGYSGGDQSLMRFLQDDSIKMNGLYWCYWDKEKPSKEIMELVKKKNGCLVPIESFDQMMFMIARQLGFESPEEEMKKVTRMRIERYNEQYDGFEKRIREKAELENATHGTIKETIQALDKFNLAQLEEADKRVEESKSYESYFSRARLNVRLLRYAEAIADYTRAIELKSDDIYSYNNRGYVYAQIQEYEKAIADYTKAIELNPDDILNYNNRGHSYNKLKEHGKAVADYTKAIKLKPDYYNAYNNRGFTYMNMQEYDKAVSDLEKAIELKPDFANPYKHLGTIFYEQKEYQKALECLNQAIEYRADYAEAFELRAKVYRALNLPEEAEKDEETVRSLKEQG